MSPEKATSVWLGLLVLASPEKATSLVVGCVGGVFVIRRTTEGSHGVCESVGC